uniref:PXA domain-containing protein n=1 Tax=Oryzias latipes TaxID=8090 RepID=A0A3P9I7T6_ORYLA
MAGISTYVEDFRRGLKLDVLRETARQYPMSCCLILCLLLLTALLNSYLHVLMIFWSVLAGVVTFYCSLGPESLVPNIFFSVKHRKKRQESALFPLGHSCAVCGKVKCKRHRPTLLLENHQPWLELKVHSKVDASIAEVFELVLENFVYPWYREITDDEASLDEVRMTFRFLASVLVRRAQKVDIPGVFADKVMKAAMKHIEIFAKAQEKAKNADALERAALEEYGPGLHAALYSRKNELLYLRKLTEMLLPYVLPPKATDCRSLALLLREVMSGSVILPTMDFMADPDTVNLMVLIFVDHSPPEPATEPPSPLVPFLQKYANGSTKKSSVLKLELKDIREQQDLLFRFLNFLKQEGAVHVLQFCLAVGTFADAQLPSKRIIGPKNYEFLQSKREEFEEYLQNLLKHPELSNSQLLADFLSPFSMESQFLEKMLPDVNLGKIFKSVPGKLMKEKGQNLEPFIQSFFNSCESLKPKPSRPELTILSPTAENKKKLFSALYQNNMDLHEDAVRNHRSNCFLEMMTVHGMYDYMMHVARVVFRIPDWLHHLLAAGRILLKNTLEAYMDQYMQSKLDQVLQEHRMVSLITQLRDAVFCESGEKRTAEDRQARAKQTFQEMIRYLPDFVGKCIGEEAKHDGVRLLFDALQQPLLNKQMAYVLLDIAVLELFPELNKVGAKEPFIV